MSRSTTADSAREDGSILAEGKTKIIAKRDGDDDYVNIISKDDITAGDGAKHDIIQGKAALSTRTTSNVFRLLKACGIPVAFVGQVDNTTFSAPLCTMLPYEVVIRREAHGSYLSRAPHLTKGHVFPKLVLEYFLKTNDKKWKDYELPCDDPYMVHDASTQSISLYHPKHPNLTQSPAMRFLVLSEKEVFSRDNEEVILREMGILARKVFLILEKAWQLQGRRLVDFKVEFGLTARDGGLVLADVIDNDSWRLLDGSGNYLDKQVYRDGGDLNTVTSNYRAVAEMTDQFSIPSQRLILWRGSDKDDLAAFYDSIKNLAYKARFETSALTCSVHKQPVRAYRLLQKHLQEVPDSVIVAFIGRSNGAGPTLSANTTVPVITVPAGYREFPEDVWSSLHTPSNVPVMTVLEPANAILAALQILAIRNPSIYAALRFDQETRMDEV